MRSAVFHFPLFRTISREKSLSAERLSFRGVYILEGVIEIKSDSI